MPDYDPGVVAAIRRIGQQRYGSDPRKLRRYLLGGYATGIVESGLKDLPGGDADSYGFRQQRESIYGRQPLNTQINNLFNEFEQYDRGQSVGELAAAVQRPAAQYRGRYAQVLDQARALANGAGVTGGSAPVGNGGGDEAVASMAAPQAPRPNPFSTIASLSPQNTSPFAATMQRGWDLLSKIWEQKYGQSGGSVLAGMGSSGGGGISATGDAADFVSRANKLDAARLPYQWGGGHGSDPVNPDKPKPVDCSGAVSAVLGIDPRVSGDFKSWGRSGEGGKEGITVYANDHHVLMKINGHFFGTSGTNPGGGAGWIPQSAISKDYLKNFTARHL